MSLQTLTAGWLKVIFKKGTSDFVKDNIELNELIEK